MQRREVIVVTDGDHFAKRALEIAAKQLPAHVISQTEGNPTKLSGVEIVQLIRDAEMDPVIVMLDDNGNGNEARGEQALQVLLSHPDIQIIGALAVASNTSLVRGVPIDFSIDCNGQRVETGVNKDGKPIPRHLVYGDTVDALRKLTVPVIVGIGDIGKMGGRDAPEHASPITTAALRALMESYTQWKRMQLAQSQDVHSE